MDSESTADEFEAGYRDGCDKVVDRRYRRVMAVVRIGPWVALCVAALAFALGFWAGWDVGRFPRFGDEEVSAARRLQDGLLNALALSSIWFLTAVIGFGLHSLLMYLGDRDPGEAT